MAFFRRELRGIAALGLVAGLVASAGCHDPPRPEKPQPAKGTVRVRTITDGQPVRMLVPAGRYLFAVGPHGVDRWQPSDGQVLPLSRDHGLPGDRVLAVAADETRDWLWMSTDGGLGYYDVANQTFSEVTASATVDLTVERAEGAIQLAPASDGGVWIGHPRGLYYTNPSGQWTGTPITTPIRALALGDDGWLWIGTGGGVIGREPTGETYQYGAEHGCDVVAVRLIARAPGGGILVIGENAAGKQRLAVRRDEQWTSYKISPDVTIDSVAAAGDAVIARGGRRLYRLAAAAASKKRKLTRDGVRLLPVRGEAATAAVTIELLPASLAADSTAVAAIGDEIFVGTRDIGISAWRADATQPARWLRRGQLVADASTVTIACRAAADCWIATGTRNAWHFDGEAFEPGGVESQAVLAVVRAADNTIYALHRSGDGAVIELSRIDRAAGNVAGPDTWTPIGVTLQTPGERPTVSFARFAPDGQLWIGLAYVDGLDVRPWGVALVDVTVGMVAYHHETSDQIERSQGVLPVPIDVVDAAFASQDEVWMATSEGVARLAGTEVTVFSEANGLASEVVRAVALGGGGIVFAATSAGVGTYDGEAWTFPRELSFPVNDLALADDGRLWMATDRGVALYDGRKVKRIDVRRGLLENEILDLTLDEHGRVWARGEASLTLISP